MIGVERLYHIGEQLVMEVTNHKPHSGGTSCAVFGYLGSGKTTLLLHLADKIFCIENGKKVIETIIWRGRQNDYWINLPKDRVRLYFHVKDYDVAYGRYPTFHNEDGEEIPEDMIPDICEYDSIEDLYKYFREKGTGNWKGNLVHVVYEPHEYEFSEELKEILTKRSMEKAERYENILVDSSLWWYEMFSWMISNKRNEYFTFIVDEADDIIMSQAGGLQWHTVRWLRDTLKDFRKKKLSLFIATHNPTDIDSTVLSKVNYKIYCSGANICSHSMINFAAAKQMPKGECYIEHDKFGKFKYPPIHDMIGVVTTFHETAELKKAVRDRRRMKNIKDERMKEQHRVGEKRWREKSDLLCIRQ